MGRFADGAMNSTAAAAVQSISAAVSDIVNRPEGNAVVGEAVNGTVGFGNHGRAY